MQEKVHSEHGKRELGLQQQLQKAKALRRFQPPAEAPPPPETPPPPPLLLLQLLGQHHHHHVLLRRRHALVGHGLRRQEPPGRTGFGKIGGSSVAVEKDSDDPYLDFRQSMLQMILEKEIYAKDDLKELLNCFLQLNAPYYHGIIVRAFTEIWNGVYSGRAGSPNLHGMWPARDY
ncbi:hypothetical protein DH2020_018185 [Rehmannia glutinosa]|uniref:Transcription repressor n=1 Tax=Rehmannia glutinosa TaxID=99300 RepID=A0ABR0WK68_REHGL